MIKTIVSILFVSQSVLGNRLILQQAPVTVIPPELPIAVPPVEPVTPVEPITPAEPATPVEPITPVEPAPPAPEPPIVEPAPPITPPVVEPPVVEPPVVEPPVVEPQPVTPEPPVAIPPVQQPLPPPAVLPPVPATPLPPAAGPGTFPWQLPGYVAQHKLECKITPPTVGTCAGQIKTITNPSDNYEVICPVVGGCYSSSINIDLTTQGYPIERLKGFWFTAEFAGMNAVITVNNQRPEPVRVDEVKCDKYAACNNMRFVLYNAYIQQGDFDCVFGACDGCTINGVPCYNYV